MKLATYGIVLDAAGATFYLWSPWRASWLEHRLFDALAHLPNVELEKVPEEVRLHVTESKGWRAAIQAVERVLKGWQEEAESGAERRSWRWMFEADTDCNGFDHAGERASMWGFLRLSLERGNPGEDEKLEEIDLNDFGFRIWPEGEEGK